ncbi:putative phosphatase regulatory subunit-domain-containing protein, partial [Bisporella sp. PMI_857]
IPPGAIISPPDSAQNSSDDEELKLEGSRGRELENLAELQAAIRTIEQHRESSPSRQGGTIIKANQGLHLIMPAKGNEVTLEQADIAKPISNAYRKMTGHNRSKTDTSVPIFVVERQNSAIETPMNGSEEEVSDDEDPNRSRRSKPPMLRKKSGELVRPALRPSSARRRPSSMPGTPTFSKAVHFDSHLEHVRHFLQVDRPLAVSAGSSPVDVYDSDNEFPFDEANGHTPPFEWEIVVSNFPAETPLRLSQPVRVERVFLSADNKNLIGTVAVANLAFNKWVVARFTLDYWKTTSEVVAEYNNDVRAPKHIDGRDRFNFNIKLADLANLEAKTMFFCVKYCVNGREYWDNNNSTNFQIDFRKKPKPQNGKKGMQGASSRPASSLPRSNKKASIGAGDKPKSMPVAFDDFDGFDEKFKFDDSGKLIGDYLGESTTPIRLKGVKSAVTLSSENRSRRSANSNGQAFGNRYDFGASLSAAINAANSALGDRSGITMKPSAKRPVTIAEDDSQPSSPLTMAYPKSNKLPAIATRTNGTDASGLAGAEIPPLTSQSYNELLDKYCFFGSVKSSPQFRDGTLRSGHYDGTNDDGYMADSTDTSSDSSPLMMERKVSTQRAQTTISPVPRSNSPAPMTGFVTGTSPMYPYQMHGGFQFHDAHAATAIRG